MQAMGGLPAFPSSYAAASTSAHPSAVLFQAAGQAWQMEQLVQSLQQQLNAANLAAQQASVATEAQATKKPAQDAPPAPRAKDEKESVDPEILRQWKRDEEYVRDYKKIQTVDNDSSSEETVKGHTPGQDSKGRAPMPKKMPIKMEKICSMETDDGNVEFFARHVPGKKKPEPKKNSKEDTAARTQTESFKETPREPAGPPPGHRRKCPPPKPHYGGEDGKCLGCECNRHIEGTMSDVSCETHASATQDLVQLEARGREGALRLQKAEGRIQPVQLRGWACTDPWPL